MKFPVFSAGRVALLVTVLAIAGCETVPEDAPQIEAMNEAIRQEAPGNYYVGRRMYKEVYKMWGWVRQPGKPWSTAQLVMFNEQRTLAPDRQGGKLGTDNNVEYKLMGYFSGETVYEPASNRFYPEFVLVSYDVRNRTPARIYTTARQNDPTVRVLTPPM